MKNTIDWSEFFKNEAGKESLDRLLFAASFPFATALALKIGNTESLGVYLASYGAVVINNKWAGRNGKHSDKISSADSGSAGSACVGGQ